MPVSFLPSRALEVEGNQIGSDLAGAVQLVKVLRFQTGIAIDFALVITFSFVAFNSRLPFRFRRQQIQLFQL